MGRVTGSWREGHINYLGASMKLSGTLATLASMTLCVGAIACSDNAPTEVRTSTNVNKTYAAPTAEALNARIISPSKKEHATLMSIPATTSIVLNGGFEVNATNLATSFTDWSVVNAGNGAYFNLSGTSSPISGFTVPSPTEGSFAAMSDQSGPGMHILYQDVAIPGSGATLEFDLFIGNRASAFYTPNSLLYTTNPNQQFRMDIVDPSASITDVGSGVLENIYQTVAGDPLVAGYNHISASLDAYAGQTIRIRFSEVDNQRFFQGGLDAVAIYPNVAIDIKPGSTTNPVNLSSNGTLPVAILSEPWFDATTINASTVTLGDNAAPETGINTHRGRLQYSTEDVDGDGDLDFVAHFPIATLVSNGDLSSTSTSLTINGAVSSGGVFSATDYVTITP